MRAMHFCRVHFFCNSTLARIRFLIYRASRHRADNNMVNSHDITTFHPEAADTAGLPNGANLLGSRRPSGSVPVFARRRAR